VKPEWLEDELMAAASDAARVLSVGLILLADDYGRGRAAPAQIGASVWPFLSERDPLETRERTARALSELSDMRFVRLYEVDRQRYFEIRNWEKHQKVNHPGKPRVPAPLAESPETLKKVSREPQETLLPDLRSPTSEKDRRSPTATPARATFDELPPYGRLINAFQSRWEAKRLSNGLALGPGWPGVLKHEHAAQKFATLYADKPDELAASLDGFFASEDPYVIEARWAFALWVGNPGKWVSARHEPSVDLDELVSRSTRADTTPALDESGPIVLEIPKSTPRKARA
jgi:hypothetical protein